MGPAVVICCKCRVINGIIVRHVWALFPAESLVCKKGDEAMTVIPFTPFELVQIAYFIFTGFIAYKIWKRDKRK